ncbi:hypothetical protein HYH03_010586 [Edaphochlamys debaryana]|uniref:Uncharacterized protein n=1 Tax=Edaphochlamys debaryana TaxID=47281 RepID=A0A835XWK7_9CHLO|nr:hypothetical protein HYH03_010586 [Edaphochlamys debaryana]|eukprot:KAG2491144.1 hypothetical protein HYH03_010586 [Edaphochlamys debaryana]
MMLSLLEAGPRPAAAGALAVLLQRATLGSSSLPQRQSSSLPRALSSLVDACGPSTLHEGTLPPSSEEPCCSNACSSSQTVGAVSGPRAGVTSRLSALWGPLSERLRGGSDQQRRGIATSSAAAEKFQSNLTRHHKSKLANRDNLQRWNESGRDVRVGAEILREAGAAGRPGGPRGGGRGGRRGGGGAPTASELHAEMKDMVSGVRDLHELQVVLREVGSDLDAALVCTAAARLPRLRQATPAASAPAALARRISETLLQLLQERVEGATLTQLAAALQGLAEAGAAPSAALIEALCARLEARGPRGSSAILEAHPRTVSAFLLAAAKLKHARAQAGAGAGAAAAAAGAAAEGDVLAARLWPGLVAAAEVKLLRALGEEPEAGGAAPVGSGDGAEPEVDDSMPQSSLRAIAKALALASEPHPGAWAATARLTARHAAELQPAIAAAVLRSYALAGGARLDGGREGLVGAVWAALQPQLADMEPAALLDLTFAAARLAADAAAADGTASSMLRPLADALAPRVPALTCAEVAMLATGLAQALGPAGPGSGPGGPRPFGALPRLLGDLLVLRGPGQFGSRNFASVALALGLVGGVDARVWARIADAVLPHVPKMDGPTLSRLSGAFTAAAATAAGAADAPAAAAGSAAAIAPPPALVAAVHERVAVLLAEGGEGVGGGRDAVHLFRNLTEWPEPEGGSGAVKALADRLAAAGGGGKEALAAAAPLLRERLVAAVRKAGLDGHPVAGLVGAA